MGGVKNMVEGENESLSFLVRELRELWRVNQELRLKVEELEYKQCRCKSNPPDELPKLSKDLDAFSAN